MERLVVGDLEKLDLVAEFGEGQFDVVVFGDVLEHLRDPLLVLRQALPLLRPGGSVVLSIPNIGHGAVRLGLLKGQFEYRSLGLLDTTHLRFFTRESVLRLLDECGLIGIDVRRTTAGLFETELGIKPEDYDPALVQTVLDDPDATTYQFVIRAIPDDGSDAIRSLNAQIDAQRLREHELQRAIDRVSDERDELGKIAHDERKKHLAAESALHEMTIDRDRLGAIAHDERQKHLEAEARVAELGSLGLFRRLRHR
jgi:SAM-dependent methyltransferase